MASRVRLVALVGLAEFWWWDPEYGEKHSGISEYVLVTTFDGVPTDGELQRALQEIRGAIADADGHAELHSHEVMDEETWERFNSPAGGFPAVVHGTGINAVIHSHGNLQEAIEAGVMAGAAFVDAGKSDPSHLIGVPKDSNQDG